MVEGSEIRDKDFNLIAECPGGPGDRCEWSEDGERAYVSEYVDGIYEIDTQSRRYKKVLRTQGFTYDHSPGISPDGTIFVWGHHEWGQLLDIYISEAKFPTSYRKGTIIWSGVTQWQDEHPYCEFLDDTRFFFIVNEILDNDKRVSRIYEVDTEKNNAVKIVFEIDEWPWPQDDRITATTLSSDRSILALSTYEDLYIFDTETWKSELVDTDIYYAELAWSPGGEYLAALESLGYAPERVIIYDVYERKKWLIKEFKEIKAEAYDITWIRD